MRLSRVFFLTALGIGSQAIVPRAPATVSLDEASPKFSSPHLAADLMSSAPADIIPTPHLVIDVGLSKESAGQGTRNASGSDVRPRASLRRSSSAMHSLMEQGGLVEIGLNADESPSVITRTISDTLALPTTPEGEAGNPTDAIALPSPLSSAPSALPSPVSVQDDSDKPPYTPQNPEVVVASATPKPPSPVPASPRDIAVPLLGPRRRSLRESHEPPTTVRQGLQVLVVDDDALTRTLMTRMLARLGCKVNTAENGEAALEMLLSDCNGRFAVVFLDNQMPVMSGLSMIGKLRQAGRSDFVVGVTGNALLSDQEEYLEAGVDK